MGKITKVIQGRHIKEAANQSILRHFDTYMLNE